MPSVRRRLADRLPLAAKAYESATRTLAVGRAQPLPTPWGFSLRGSAVQAAAAFEPAEVQLVQQILPQVDAFIDVGANIGLYTCLAGQAGVPTVAVEPQPDNLDLLYANLQDNRVKKVSVMPLALGATPGLLTLYGAGTGASLVHGWAGASRGAVVAVTTLDIVCLGMELLGKRLLIKVDVEGAELDLLRGAPRVLAARPAPRWLAEVAFSEHHPDGVNPHFRDVFEAFWRHGYQATEVSTGKVVLAEDVSDWLRRGSRGFGSYNYLFEAVEA